MRGIKPSSCRRKPEPQFYSERRLQVSDVHNRGDVEQKGRRKVRLPSLNWDSSSWFIPADSESDSSVNEKRVSYLDHIRKPEPLTGGRNERQKDEAGLKDSSHRTRTFNFSKGLLLIIYNLSIINTLSRRCSKKSSS
ncbi:hypothetical protein ATANTOWER_000344 [Ataeniobius toweri]|uniref:Uncharacterized protein n=1 Tax=Ataeniobius toweri TaxID=208326 RepID=A0ABU7A4D7_9TELE|nr:hypothetical protein [Ataeniobius toweri]